MGLQTLLLGSENEIRIIIPRELVRKGYVTFSEETFESWLHGNFKNRPMPYLIPDFQKEKVTETLMGIINS